MLILFDIVFQSGEFFNQGDGSNFFWKMLPSILGSLIGFGGSLLLYYKKNKHDKDKDEAKKLADRNERETNTLNYFIALLKSVLKIAEKQSGYYKKHSDNLTNKPFEQHFLNTVIAEDVNRILHKLDHERVFHSYLSRFDTDTARIEIFQKIFNRLDFIEAIYQDAIKLHEKLQEELMNSKLKYKDLAEEETKSYCAELINVIKQSDPNYLKNPFWNLLNNSILNYHQNKPIPETIEYMQTAFINPIKVAIISNFRHIPEAMRIADNCRKATWLYSEIKIRSETLGKDFDRANTNMEKSIGELRDFTKDLIS